MDHAYFIFIFMKILSQTHSGFRKEGGFPLIKIIPYYLFECQIVLVLIIYLLDSHFILMRNRVLYRIMFYTFIIINFDCKKLSQFFWLCIELNVLHTK